MENDHCLANRDRLMNWVVGVLLTLGWPSWSLSRFARRRDCVIRFSV